MPTHHLSILNAYLGEQVTALGCRRGKFETTSDGTRSSLTGIQPNGQAAFQWAFAQTAAQEAVRSEEFHTARRLMVGIGPGKSDGSGQPSANRDTVELLIPFNDTERRSYYTVPTVASIYDPATYSYRADEAIYLQQAKASTVAQIYFSDVRIGKAAARIRWYIDGGLV